MMARLSRQPFETFGRNLRKACGLVRLQFYVEDLFLTGGQESLGRLQKFADEVMGGLLGPTGVQELIQTHLAQVLEAKFKAMDRSTLILGSVEHHPIRRRPPKVDSPTEKFLIKVAYASTSSP